MGRALVTVLTAASVERGGPKPGRWFEQRAGGGIQTAGVFSNYWRSVTAERGQGSAWRARGRFDFLSFGFFKLKKPYGVENQKEEPRRQD